MSYTAAQMTAATSALVAAIHGLHPDVARAWATAEQGANYNILGVTYTDASGQHLFKYTSWAQGAEAAWNLILHGPYGGIRASLINGTSQQQAAAIIASPWNHPYYSTGAGASALRTIAHGTPSSPAPLYVLTFRGATEVYQTAVPVNPVGTIYSMTANATRHLINGRWWYQITSARMYVGKWVVANGFFSATPK